uniref:Wsv216-like protein n=1 Tax=Metapenaeus ensis nimavirus TaxID=2133794 RepID=A0A401IPA8_9VIRU|nr:MAG: wsv216-like protein [Metapenaeus ensis nimavirus]GBG35431.1 wsv216-like protein [Metapenaeus ensis nimavirus]
MLLPAVIKDVFGTWWGVFEFVTLLVVVVIVSFIGVRVTQSNFTRDGKTGELKTPLGGDGKALYKAVMFVVNTSAESEETRGKAQNFATSEVANIIRLSAEREIEKIGLTPSNRLVERVTKRTAEQIGLKIMDSPRGEIMRPTSGRPQRLSAIQQEEEQEAVVTLPFKTIDIRSDSTIAPDTASYAVKLFVVDGVLPNFIPLPFYMRVWACVPKSEKEEEEGLGEDSPTLGDLFPEVATSFWPPKTNVVKNEASFDPQLEMVFDDLYVETLAGGILLNSSEGRKMASLFAPQTEIKLKIEAYGGKEDGSKTLLYSGRAKVSSPLPKLKEVFSCKNLVVMRIDNPPSPYYDLIHYPAGSLNQKYVTEYPHNMPELTRDAVEAANVQAKLIERAIVEPVAQVDKGVSGIGEQMTKEGILARPTVAFIYSREAPVNTLTHDLYVNVIKRGLEPEKYIVTPAERVSVIRDPSRPSERYMSVSIAQTSIPERVILMGWVVGFEDGEVFGENDGFNVVFPADLSDEGFASKFFEEVCASILSDQSVVLHNTKDHIGCFGNEEDLPRPDNGRDLLEDWAGPVNGERYFSYHLRPCLVVKQKDATPPEIVAIMCSPATKYAGEQTGLLPRRLSISGGPLPLVEGGAVQLFDTVMLGGGHVTFEIDNGHERLFALFPTLRTRTRVVDETDRPFAPLHQLLSRNRTSILPIRKVITKNDDLGYAILRAFDRKTGVALGGSIVPLGGEVATVNALFVDCSKDVIFLEVSIFGRYGVLLPLRLTGKLTGQFVGMKAPSHSTLPWLVPESYKTDSQVIALSSARTTVVICRTTHPPITDRGVREPFRKLSGLVPFPSAPPPPWAFTGIAQNKFPRHIFVSSVRQSEEGNTIVKSDGSLFSVGEWLKENLRFPTNEEAMNDLSKEYAGGQKAYARMYLGPEVSDAALDQILNSHNGARIVSENGSVKEILLKNDQHGNGWLVGDWGFIVFGSNPHPSEPADRFSVWRMAGRLRMVIPGMSQPVTPLQNTLATWPNGDPILRTQLGAFLRLDPRIGGICSANGLYNSTSSNTSKMTTSLSLVVVENGSGLVKYVKRLPLWYMLMDEKIVLDSTPEATNNLKPVDRSCAIQRRLWNRTSFDNDELMLCVKIPTRSEITQGTAIVIVDHLVFACSASVAPDIAREKFYCRFISDDSDDVVFDSSRDAFNITVAQNFSTMCGFAL